MAGGVALDAGWLLVAILVAAVLAAVGIAVRRTLLERGGGTVECGLRRDPDQNWRLGLAAYQPDELRWFNAFGVRLRPQAVFARSGLGIISRRPVASAEVASVGKDAVVVECKVSRSALGDSPAGRGASGSDGSGAGSQPGDGVVELAMSEAALTGFLAWLEATPPQHPAGLA